MEEWIIIDYRQYWDVPREFVVHDGVHAYYLDSPFDEALDDYAPDFSVYQIPLSLTESLESWSRLPLLGIRLPDIPVRLLKFKSEMVPGGSPTRRYLRYVHRSTFDLIARSEKRNG